MKNSTSKCPLHPNTILSSYCSKCGIIMCPNCSLDHKHSQVSRIPKSFAEKYDFKKYLGAGCSGKVFSCTSYFDSNEYALKLIEIDSDDKLTVFEAQKEIEILQKINHQNIIRYYDNEYLEEDETFGILMELGESNLMDVIKSIDQKQAFSYFRQICSAVEYIHINLGYFIFIFFIYIYYFLSFKFFLYKSNFYNFFKKLNRNPS